MIFRDDSMVNLVNSSGKPVYSCESRASLSALKGELNFSGWVVSDWGADHGSVRSLNAGMDQTMGGGFDFFAAEPDRPDERVWI